MAAAGTTDFFELQDEARRESRRLIVYFLLAALFVIASYCAAAWLVYLVLAKFQGWPLRPPAILFQLVGGVVVGTIVLASLHRMWTLRQGGATVAWLLGARYIEPARCNPAERRLLNVVEEMAIASGIGVPPVYSLDREDAVNALAAGHSPNEAVLVVTRGAMTRLTRDELQGVMAHEFSHILNGDMALNLKLVGVLAGLNWFGEQGEELVLRSAQNIHNQGREDRSPEAVNALAGLLLAFIGFPGSVAADAIKAAIGRQREFLADAASVQFTRNPDGIAGALDSILSLRAQTTVHAAHVSDVSHMFFATAVARWWGFPTHPPIQDRIRRAHPRFNRDEYRRTRPGVHERREVAVIDGAGNVVKNIAGVAALAASVGHPTRAHIDAAGQMLASLPPELRERLKSAEGARQALLELAHGKLTVPRQVVLPLCELALPLLKGMAQPERDRFLADLSAATQADGRVTLGEFVLQTYLKQHLREGAGKPISARYRKIDEIAADAHVVLSLIAHASGGDVAGAFAKGLPMLGVALDAPLPVAELSTARIGEALERLRLLAPMVKPRLLKACLDAASADGQFRIGEAELVRTVAATLDCPVPPALYASPNSAAKSS